MLLLRRLRALLALTALAALSACSTQGVLPDSPEIQVSNVEIVEIGFDQQVFLFNLDAYNPNKFDVPLNGVEFVLRLSDVEVGQGLSQQDVTLVSAGNTNIPVEVTTNLADSMDNFKELFLSGGLKMDYEMDGKLRLVGESVGIPFTLRGNLVD